MVRRLVAAGAGVLALVLLVLLVKGCRDSAREQAFRVAVQAEERQFLGDASAWAVLDRLGPLLEDGELSERGRAVLAGRQWWSPEEERWIGGVRLPPGPAPWRWDPKAETLV